MKEKNILEMFNHECVPKVIDFKEDDMFKKSYLIMQLFEGATLDQYVSENGCLSEEKAKKWFRDLINAISMIHDKKIAHRDVKPQNLMINDNFDIMLIDFNISKKGKTIYKDEKDTKWKYKFKYRFLTQVSTPLYAAPELVNHWLYTESIDIWGAGVILYLMVFGDIPFQTKGEEVKEYTSDLHQTFIDHLNSDTRGSSEWKDLILKMLAFDSNERPDCQECLVHPWLSSDGSLVDEETKEWSDPPTSSD